MLLDLSTGISYALNPTAAAVWNVLASNPSGVGVEGLVQALEQTLSSPRARTEADVLAFLSSLEIKSLITRIPVEATERS